MYNSLSNNTIHFGILQSTNPSCYMGCTTFLEEKDHQLPMVVCIHNYAHASTVKPVLSDALGPKNIGGPLLTEVKTP